MAALSINGLSTNRLRLVCASGFCCQSSDYETNSEFLFLQDLASLLKALYDAVGQSISLPQSASTSKKLRLRLTVSPDTAKSGNKVKETKDKVRKETLKNVKYSSKIPNKDTTKAATPKDTVKVRGEKESWKIHKPASDKANKESSNQKEQTNDLSGKSSGKAKLSATEEKQLAELIQRNMIKQQRLQSCHRHLRYVLQVCHLSADQ